MFIILSAKLIHEVKDGKFDTVPKLQPVELCDNWLINHMKVIL